MSALKSDKCNKFGTPSTMIFEQSVELDQNLPAAFLTAVEVLHCYPCMGALAKANQAHQRKLCSHYHFGSNRRARRTLGTWRWGQQNRRNSFGWHWSKLEAYLPIGDQHTLAVSWLNNHCSQSCSTSHTCTSYSDCVPAFKFRAQVSSVSHNPRLAFSSPQS